MIDKLVLALVMVKKSSSDVYSFTLGIELPTLMQFTDMGFAELRYITYYCV